MDQKVKQFLDNLELFVPEKEKIISALRKIVIETIPEVAEVMMYGGIVYKTDRLLCGLFARKKHITVEFGKGAEMDDPYLVLEGKGKGRRHIIISNFNDVEDKKVKYYIEQSINL